MTYLRDVPLPYAGTTVSGSPEHVAHAVAYDRMLASEEADWIADLRARGVKAAHPDDGWVDREKQRIHLAYPQFCDGLGVGDLLALGSATRTTRFVRITGTSPNRIATGPDRDRWYWHFEATTVPLSRERET